MTDTRFIGAAILSTFNLASCAETIKTQPVSAALEPMPVRSAMPGDTLVWLDG